ncbi:MAG: TlpA family protein disulfide reductase [Bacteroidetes bacterium]|nr:TlpA family protein disulfide reductase [Bacteroidota bacterium]
MGKTDRIPLHSRKAIALSIIAFIIIAGCFGYLYIQNNFIVQPLAIGDTVPPAEVQTLDGKDVAIRSLINKKTIILFFSTGCSHCKDGMKNLLLLKPLIDDSIDIFCISIDGKEETIDFIKEMNVVFPVYLDLKNKAKDAFHVLPIPVIYFLNKDFQMVRFIVSTQSVVQLQKAFLQFKNNNQDAGIKHL